ncbi:hypothetical protein [Tahibacter harae]|uniref:Secreted protein n=1 Tax=Tahibacter harae TaxID=2963937 RepID=A0ABT1QLX4_9GAMM|nr:hypothetical protein [Tahibacter harae]MCQ4163529.1 hypothetical protein [Tahibacter harae]
MRRAPIRSAAGLALGLLVFAGSAAGDGAKSRLEQVMGAKFREAGLERATPAEIAVLEQFIIEHADELRALEHRSDRKSAAAVTGADAERERRADKNVVSSRIAGEFKGWRQGTTLTLENGQQWRIDDNSTLTVPRALANPAVTIKPGTFGNWWLRVEGYNTTAKVKPAN